MYWIKSLLLVGTVIRGSEHSREEENSHLSRFSNQIGRSGKRFNTNHALSKSLKERWSQKKSDQEAIKFQKGEEGISYDKVSIPSKGIPNQNKLKSSGDADRKWSDLLSELEESAISSNNGYARSEDVFPKELFKRRTFLMDYVVKKHTQLRDVQRRRRYNERGLKSSETIDDGSQGIGFSCFTGCIDISDHKVLDLSRQLQEEKEKNLKLQTKIDDLQAVVSFIDNERREAEEDNEQVICFEKESQSLSTNDCERQAEILLNIATKEFAVHAGVNTKDLSVQIEFSKETNNFSSQCDIQCKDFSVQVECEKLTIKDKAIFEEIFPSNINPELKDMSEETRCSALNEEFIKPLNLHPHHTRQKLANNDLQRLFPLETNVIVEGNEEVPKALKLIVTREDCYKEWKGSSEKKDRRTMDNSVDIEVFSDDEINHSSEHSKIMSEFWGQLSNTQLDNYKQSTNPSGIQSQILCENAESEDSFAFRVDTDPSTPQLSRQIGLTFDEGEMLRKSLDHHEVRKTSDVFCQTYGSQSNELKKESKKVGSNELKRITVQDSKKLAEVGTQNCFFSSNDHENDREQLHLNVFIEGCSEAQTPKLTEGHDTEAHDGRREEVRGDFPFEQEGLTPLSSTRNSINRESFSDVRVNQRHVDFKELVQIYAFHNNSPPSSFELGTEPIRNEFERLGMEPSEVLRLLRESFASSLEMLIANKTSKRESSSENNQVLEEELIVRDSFESDLDREENEIDLIDKSCIRTNRYPEAVDDMLCRHPFSGRPSFVNKFIARKLAMNSKAPPAHIEQSLERKKANQKLGFLGGKCKTTSFIKALTKKN